MLRGYCSLQSQLDKCIINAQVFSTIGHEEVMS